MTLRQGLNTFARCICRSGGSLAIVAALSTTTAHAETRPNGAEDPRDPPKVLRLKDGAKPSTKEEQVLSEIERDFERFRKVAERHGNRVETILLREYERRKNTLERRYADRIGEAEKTQRERRLNAMKVLEKFIKDHPDHPQFTPDAMFRLADLHLDQANEDFERKFDLATEAIAEVDDIGEEEELVADYSRSLDLWSRVVSQFPTYRQRPSATYLLAYYLKQTGEERRALAVARGLVCSNQYDPSSPAVPEPAQGVPVDPNAYANCKAAAKDEKLAQDAWVRIVGDIHFLTPGELPHAIAAYSKVADDEKSPFYDEALYKLAWSHYRDDNFVEGIRAFDKSIKYSDTLVAQGKDPLELRPEALQYIAISFTDPWGVDEQPDPVRAFDRAFAFYKDRLDEPHVRDVFVQLGDTFEILEAWDQAINSWQIALKHAPLHIDNPKVHQKIVIAFQSKDEQEIADEEAAKMALLYAEGSEWYKANETNREALEMSQGIGERMLKAAALNMHRSAQQARAEYEASPSEEGKQRYLSQYAKAAQLYRRFITENPTADEIYEFTYFLGDTYYWSGNYPRAIEHYKWIRDHRDLSSDRFEKAALSVVQSYEKEIERQVAAGKLAPPPEPTIDQLRGMNKPITQKTIPPIYLEWQEALDTYQELVNDPESAPEMGYLAGLISYRYLNLDDAAKRFELTFEKFCGEANSVKAKDALLAIYEATGQDGKFESTNQRFIAKKCGSDEDIQMARAQNRSKKFREAESFGAENNHDLAALAFYRYYLENPGDDPNRPIALYNSALNYDKAGKPKTAVHLYREFTADPTPAFRNSEYYLTALYLTAVSYNNAFDYDNAVKAYLDVVKIAQEPGRKTPAGIDLDLKSIQLTSLYNAALLRELDRDYQGATGAIALYRRYAAVASERAEREKALWAIARIYKNSNQLTKLATAYTDWRRAHGRIPGNENKYVFSFYDMAKQYEKRGQASQAKRLKNETVRAWEAVGSPRGTAASDMAAEFAFEQAEAHREAGFEKFKITRAPRTEKEAKQVLGKLDSLSDGARKKYEEIVTRYESSAWSLAATTRFGDVFFFQGLKFKEAPPPKELVALDQKYPEKDVLLQYQDALDARAQPLIDQAAKQWEKVVTVARQKGLASKWSQLAQERLHDFIDQSRFPVLRQELIEGTEQP